jgi:hypothetical protein
MISAMHQGIAVYKQYLLFHTPIITEWGEGCGGWFSR